MSDGDERDGLTVGVMVIGVMILITYMCWATAASAYFGSLIDVAPPEPGTGRFGGRTQGMALMMGTVISFVLNSLRVHHAPGIIANTFQHEQWILLTFAILMGAAALFGVWVKKLEAALAGPRPKRKGKRRKKKKKKKKRPGAVR